MCAKETKTQTNQTSVQGVQAMPEREQNTVLCTTLISAKGDSRWEQVTEYRI